MSAAPIRNAPTANGAVEVEAPRCWAHSGPTAVRRVDALSVQAQHMARRERL